MGKKKEKKKKNLYFRSVQNLQLLDGPKNFPNKDGSGSYFRVFWEPIQS
jgi:hypothetical protein